MPRHGPAGPACATRLSGQGLVAALKLLEGLAPLFSVEVMLPRKSVSVVRSLIDYGDSVLHPQARRILYPSSTAQADLRPCPEVESLLKEELLGFSLRTAIATGDVAGYDLLKSFLLGLCDLVDGIADRDVQPPPPSPIPGSYNPPLNGVALYFSDHGEQLRWPRRYDPNKKEPPACTKNFSNYKKRTGGVLRYSND